MITKEKILEASKSDKHQLDVQVKMVKRQEFSDNKVAVIYMQDDDESKFLFGEYDFLIWQIDDSRKKLPKVGDRIRTKSGNKKDVGMNSTVIKIMTNSGKDYKG